jgi:flagellar M-ring protein FliF
VPGAQANQPPVPATAPINGQAQALQGAQGAAGAGNTRREATTAFEVDRTQRTTRAASGTVRRLSAAVVVNHRTATDARGRTSTTPLTAEEIQNLTALVEQSMGFNKERGDSVRVVNAPFRSEPKAAPEEIPLWKQPWVLDTLRSLAMPATLAFVALLIVMTTIRPALKSLMAPPPPPEPGSNVNALLDETPLLPGEDPAQPGTAVALAGPGNNARLDEARALARQNPAAVANIVRSMITGEQAAA